MKKLFLFTTALCSVALAAANLSALNAFAEADEGLNEYPQDFTKEIVFENLEDYAVHENKFAFLENGVIHEYSNEEFYGFQDDGLNVKAVYYDISGALCYGNDEGIFRHDIGEPAEVIKPETTFTLNGYHYSFDKDGVLNAYNEQTTQVTPLEGFSNLKKFGEKAYAVKENALYVIEGTTSAPCELKYLDFSATQTINAAGAETSLRNLSLETPRFVALKDGVFLTEINADKLDGKYFETGKTLKTGKDIPTSTALLIATAGTEGSISMVMLCGETRNVCYILRTADTEPVERQAISVPVFNGVATPDLAATVTVGEGFIYTAPFVCKSTQIAQIKAGENVKITGAVLKTDNPEIARDFYKVEFIAENDYRVTGYVPFGYVSPYEFIEKPPVEQPDPDYSEQNLIKPVVLIIVVIALVLIAVGYLIFVATDGKNKKDKKKNQ